jgi:glycine betaine/proline transport system substrate-binding protein
LGTNANPPKDLQNPIVYKSVALGDVDYWTNGWFPNHNSQLPKNFYDKADTYGYVVKAGGLQGYLVSEREIEKLGIKSSDDFRRPEVKKAFDSDGDGKADLTACPPGWGCENVIAHHMKVYDLEDHINPVKASYEAGMASALGAYSSGDPIKLGFVVSDIQVVANKKFMDDIPAAKTFLESMTLPPSDINEQNTRLNGGEKSQKDIEKHVDEWIAKNQDKWNSWLEAAREAAK